MAHHDLYSSLGLDRSAPPDVLAGEIDRRLAWAQVNNPAAVEELSCARAVLGDADRRTTYDRMLDDPTGPPVTADTLRQLAASSPASSPAGGAAGALRVLVPVLALLVGLGLGVGGMLLFSGNDSDDAGSGGISGADRRTVEAMAREFIALDSREAVLDWAEDNFDRRVRNETIEEFGVHGSMSDFTDMESLFGGTGLTVAAPTEFGSVVAYQAIGAGTTMQDALDNFSRDQNFTAAEIGTSLMVTVLDRSDRALGFLVFIDGDDDYRLGGFGAARVVDDGGYGWDT